MTTVTAAVVVIVAVFTRVTVAVRAELEPTDAVVVTVAVVDLVTVPLATTAADVATAATGRTATAADKPLPAEGDSATMTTPAGSELANVDHVHDTEVPAADNWYAARPDPTESSKFVNAVQPADGVPPDDNGKCADAYNMSPAVGVIEGVAGVVEDADDE
jgi:hypothetical protein